MLRDADELLHAMGLPCYGVFHDPLFYPLWGSYYVCNFNRAVNLTTRTDGMVQCPPIDQERCLVDHNAAAIQEGI